MIGRSIPAAWSSRTRAAIASAPSGARRSTESSEISPRARFLSPRLPGGLDLGQVRDRARERVAVGRDACVLHHVAPHPLPRGVQLGAGVAEERRHDQQLVRVASRARRAPSRTSSTRSAASSGGHQVRNAPSASSPESPTMFGRIAPTTTGIRGPCGSVVLKPCERTYSPSSASFSPSSACRSAGRNSRT